MTVLMGNLSQECIRGFQSTLKYKATKPSKSLISQRNLGTIRARKSAKRAQPAGGGNTEMIMRILRMRWVACFHDQMVTLMPSGV